MGRAQKRVHREQQQQNWRRGRESSSNLRWAASKAIETKDAYNNGQTHTLSHTNIHIHAHLT